MATANQIELPFRIGAKYWIPDSCGSQVEILCPVCAGHCAIVVTLGNGEQVRVSCDACARGCEFPSGYVSEFKYEPGTRAIMVLGVDSMYGGKWSVKADDGRTYSSDQLFATEAQALACSSALVAEAWERMMTTYQRKREVGKTGWTVRYHRQQIAKLKQQIEWHEKHVRTLGTEQKADGRQ